MIAESYTVSVSKGKKSPGSPSKTTIAETTFTTPDPCAAAKFMEGNSLSEQQPGLYKDLANKCKAQSGSAPNPPVPTKVAPEVPGSNQADGPPSPPDDPYQEGASGADTNSTVSAKHSPYDVDPQTPTDDIYAQDRPTPPDVAVDSLQPDATPEASEALKDRLVQNGPMPGQPDPTRSGETTRHPSKGGEPVDLFRGLLTITKIDLDVPAPLLPLRLVRSYESGRPYFGPWGYGWDHNYNVYVRELADGGVARWTGELHEDYFRWTGDAFQPERGVHDRLEHWEGEEQAYLLTRPGGVTLRFARPAGWSDAERIPLVDVRDRHDSFQSLTYDALNRLTRVDDEAGRALIFLYGDCGLLEGLEDHSGRHVEYDHHPDVEHLARVVTPPTAAYPNGAATFYEYDFLNDHLALQHNLIRITDADENAYLENEYGDDPASGWSFNRVIAQRYGDFFYEYTYEQTQYVPEDPIYVDVPSLLTTVSSPDGALHAYTFNYRGDLLDYRLRLNIDGSYRIVAQQWEYDAQGNVTAAVQPDGSRTQYTYDSGSTNPCARGNLLTIELHAPLAAQRTVFQRSYDPAYQLPVEITDENHATTRLFYDFDVGPGPTATGKLRRIEWPTVTQPDGTVQTATTTIETNDRGQVTAVVTPEGARDEVAYFDEPLLSGFIESVVRDVAGAAYTVVYEYDGVGYPRRTTTPPGVVTETIYNALGQREELILPAVAGSVARIESRYSDTGMVVSVRRPRGDYVDGVIADDHILDTYSYDVLGHPTKTVIGANTANPRVSTFCVDHEGRVVEATDPIGMRVTHCHDERGLVLSEKIASGTTDEIATRHVYDRVGRLARTEGPGDLETKIERDPWGRVAQIILPNGSNQLFTWGVLDRLLEVSVEGDPGDGTPMRLLSRRAFEYDERGRLIRQRSWSFTSDPASAIELTTQYFNDQDGRLREIRNPRGGVTSFAYDGLDRPVRAEDPHGNVRHTSYDAAGNIQQIVREELGPSGAHVIGWTYSHDERGRLRSVHRTAGGAIELDYDDRDLLVERREPLDVKLRFQHGLLGEVEEQVLDPDGLAIPSHHEHDLVGRLIRLIDPTNQTTVWSRDLLGRTTSTTLPDGSVWTRRYGPLGSVVQEQTPSGSSFSFEYDPSNGRLSSVACSPGADVVAVPAHEFAYDGLDRLVSASVGGHEIVRAHDSLGRLINEHAAGKSVHFDYDDLAGTVDLVFPDGRRERIETDVADRPTQITLISPGALPDQLDPVLARVSYDGPSRIHSITLGNGVETSFVYDDTLRPIMIEHTADGEILESTRYLYDIRDRRRVEQFESAAPGTRMHQFDARDRLTEARWDFPASPFTDALAQDEQDAAVLSLESEAIGANHWLVYDLDASDSRLTATEFDGNANVTTYSYAPGHRAVMAGGEAIDYHADGPRKKDATRAYDIDALGRVVRVRDALTSATLAEFNYDALSRLASGETNGVAFSRWFAGGRWVHEEAGSSEPVRQQTLHPVLPLPLAFRTASSAAFPLTDASLSTVCITSASGDIIERHRFDPFGAPRVFSADGLNTLPPSAAAVEPIFNGMPYLFGINAFQAGVRLYDAPHGLFDSRDPVLYGESPSPYVYAHHNPIDMIDPGGEFAFVALLILAGIGAAAGIIFSATRQAIKIAEGGQESFSGVELAKGALTGAVAAPALVLAPELALPMSAYGIAGGIAEYQHGNKFTAAFDIGTSVLPFLFKEPRNAAIGEGTLIGLGKAASWETRLSRFHELETTSQLRALDRARRAQGDTRPRKTQELFRDWVEAWINTSDKSDPIRNFVDPQTGRLLSARSRRYFDLHERPALDAGHLVSKKAVRDFGGVERLALEDAYLNRVLSGQMVEGMLGRGYIFDEGPMAALDIRGLPVDIRTARLYGELGGIPRSLVTNARGHPGWTPLPWHRTFTLEHPGLAPLPFAAISPLVLRGKK